MRDRRRRGGGLGIRGVGDLIALITGSLKQAPVGDDEAAEEERRRDGRAPSRIDAVSRVIPGLSMLRSYRPSLIGKDLVAGLVLTTLLVPQGMAYAELAGLPVITGLYTTILALIGYALFGLSRILVLGPDSALGPMIAATLVPLVAADGSSQTAVTYASVLALMVGAITVLAGVFKLGFIADLLSKPTQIGYMNGLALTILVSQLPKLFGFGKLDAAKATKAELRGEQLFSGKAQCATCHAPPYYTDNSMHNLMVERFFKEKSINGRTASADGPIKTFPLRGIKNSPPYLHDDRLIVEDARRVF